MQTSTTPTTVQPLATKQAQQTLQDANIARVQELVAEYQAGRPEGYLAGVSDDMKGSVLGGLIPGGDNFTNKEGFMALMGAMGEYMEVQKFEPKNWRAYNDDVVFNVDWKFVWKPTGKVVETTALVRKVVKHGFICEKYHMVDTEAITGEKAPHDPATVARVQELLGEIAKGNPMGYMAGVSEDVKAEMLGGLIPGADKIANKQDFLAVMGVQGEYMEVQKFEPHNFMALPNNDMMFNVDWKFVWKPTGKLVETTAIVRKVLRAEEGGAFNICEKYHMLDKALIADLTKDSPREVIG